MLNLGGEVQGLPDNQIKSNLKKTIIKRTSSTVFSG